MHVLMFEWLKPFNKTSKFTKETTNMIVQTCLSMALYYTIKPIFLFQSWTKKTFKHLNYKGTVYTHNFDKKPHVPSIIIFKLPCPRKTKERIFFSKSLPPPSYHNTTTSSKFIASSFNSTYLHHFSIKLHKTKRKISAMIHFI